jgi:hypothetical protein
LARRAARPKHSIRARKRRNGVGPYTETAWVGMVVVDSSVVVVELGRVLVVVVACVDVEIGLIAEPVPDPQAVTSNISARAVRQG